MSKFIDLTGKTFNRLTALERIERKCGTNAIWKCQCECGKKTLVRADKLRSGRTISCGCYKKEVHQERPAKEAFREVVRNTNFKHDITGTSKITSWESMINFYYSVKEI